MVKKIYQNPEGGLNAKGRAYFKNKEGDNLKPPVSAEEAGTRFRVVDAYNNTQSTKLIDESTTKMNELFLTANVKSGAPERYNFNGVDSNGDNLTDIYPIPDAVYNLRFNIIKPQAELTVATTKMLVPAEPVIFHALAKALIERGEDGGLTTNEAYQLFQQSLADHIATESGRYPDEFVWGSV